MDTHLNSIILSDCLQALPQLPAQSVDLIVTDPPYLACYRSRDGRTVPNDDNSRWLEPSFAQLYRVLKTNSYCVTFYGWPHADKFVSAFRKAGFRIVGHFVFPKGYSSSSHHVGYRHECAYLLAKGSPKPQHQINDVIPWSYTGNKLHPTQKPVSVLKELVAAFSAEGQTVLDPFAGSGSSLMAAKLLNRNYIGCELDRSYHRIATKRMRGRR